MQLIWKECQKYVVTKAYGIASNSHGFVLFITCETSSMKKCFVLATGLPENLTQVVFRQPFGIQHVRTRSLNCKN